MKLILIAVMSFAFVAKAIAQTSQEVVAAVLIGEAGGEGLKGMQAVLEVIHTRARESRKTLHATVTARFQFSCLNRVSPKRLVQTARRHPRWSDAMNLAAMRKVTTNWTRGANHYHEITIDPGWPNRTARVGRHIFYRFT